MKKLVSAILAIILCFALAVSALAGTYTAPAAKAITLDGAITEEEWGKPTFKGVSKASSMDGSIESVMSYWDFDSSYAGTESYDLYVNNDSENIYLGLVMHDTVIDADSMGANLWQHQIFAFTISTITDGAIATVDYEGQNYEQYTGFHLGLLANGSTACAVLTQGLDGVMLNNDQYKIVYDEANKTMTYEVAVPYGLTNIDINKSTSMALSAYASLPYSSNGVNAEVNGSSRFLVGTAAALCGGPGNYAHNGQTVTVTLNSADAVAGIVGGVAEEAPEEIPEEAPEETLENENTAPSVTTVIEQVERHLVLKATPQLIIIIACSVVIVFSIVVIFISFKKKMVTKEPEAPSEE